MAQLPVCYSLSQNTSIRCCAFLCFCITVLASTLFTIMNPHTTQSVCRIVGILVFGLLWLSIFWKSQYLGSSQFTHDHMQSHISYHTDLPTSQQQQQQQVAVVVASRKKDNTSWLTDALPDWDLRIYVTDDSDAALTVPLNKGREAMVYLT